MIRESKGLIESENPSNHWRFLPVAGERILDLGCGLNSNETPTPVYWINNGASLVVGVDPSQQSYDWFKKNFIRKNFIHTMDYIDRIEKFELYFDYCKPTVVKMDIEGSEVYLNGLDSKYLETVNHIGIEYHNLPCLVSCERLLQDNGFEIDYYNFGNLDISYQGVIHGKKI